MSTTIVQSFIAATRPVRGITTDGTYIYWVNGDIWNGSIGRANLDGTGVNNSFISTLNWPFGVAVDGSHVYWGSEANPGSIGRANLDGTGKNVNFITGLGSSTVVGVAVDSSYIYWAERGRYEIGRANLDGSGVNQSFITGLAGTPTMWALAIDGSYVYIADGTALKRANIDGSGLTTLCTLADTIIGLSVDSTHIYWVDGANPSKIGRANLDGSGVNASYVVGFYYATALAIDGAGDLYWGSYTGGGLTAVVARGIVTPPVSRTFSLTQGQGVVARKAPAEALAVTQAAVATHLRAVTAQVAQGAVTARREAVASVQASTQVQYLDVHLPGLFTQRQAALAVRNRGVPETLTLTQAASVLRGAGRARSAMPPTQSQAVGGGDRDYVGGAMSFTRIQIRRDTAANWTSANPVLADGEPGYEHDTGKEKLGDGSTAWADLPYVGGGGVTVKTARISVSAAGHSSDYSGMTVLHDDIGIAVGDGGYANTLKIPLAKLYHVHMEWLPQSRGYGGSVFSDINGGAGPASGHIYFASLPVSGITLLGGSIRSFAGDNWVPMFTTDGTNWMLGSPGIDLDGPVVDLVIAGDANFSSHGGAAPSDFDDYAVMLGMPDLTVTDIDTTYASNVAQNFVTDKLLVTVEALS